jgi:hypothetical protein
MNLPIELIYIIFKKLSSDDAISFGKTNKYYYNIFLNIFYSKDNLVMYRQDYSGKIEKYNIQSISTEYIIFDILNNCQRCNEGICRVRHRYVKRILKRSQGRLYCRGFKTNKHIYCIPRDKFDLIGKSICCKCNTMQFIKLKRVFDGNCNVSSCSRLAIRDHWMEGFDAHSFTHLHRLCELCILNISNVQQFNLSIRY